MKKIKLITGFFFIYACSFSQCITTAFSADAMNVFYIGVDNPVTAVSSGDPDSIYIVNGTLTRIDTCTYNGKKIQGSYSVRVFAPGECELSFFKKGKQLGSQKFRCKRIPEPFISFCGRKSGDSIEVREIKNASYVIAKLDAFDFGASFSVVTYELSCVSKVNKPKLTGASAKLTTETKAMLSDMKPGDKFIFILSVKGPDGEIRALQPSVYIAKD